MIERRQFYSYQKKDICQNRTQTLTSTISTASHTASNIRAASWSPGIGVSLAISPRSVREIRNRGETVVTVDFTIVVFFRDVRWCRDWDADEVRN
jgi:hypothetical protein